LVDAAESLEELRRRIRKEREREWIRDAILLRGRKPEETLHTMFDLINFAEKIKKARKCEP
jgi:hypothetical protein